MSERPIRVVLAKLGLDGHDRGIKVVARALRDAGMEVIYTGLWQTPERVGGAVADEDADAVGISLLSGAHLTLVPRLLERMKAEGLEQVPVIVGGTIPEEDVKALEAAGGAKIFGPGGGWEEFFIFIRAPAPALKIQGATPHPQE